MGLYVRQLKLGPMDNFVYLVGAEGAQETAIVDPAWDVAAAVRAAEEDGRSLTHALVSHHHFDHVNGVPFVLSRSGIRVFAHRADVPSLAPEVKREVTPVDAGDPVEVGPLRIQRDAHARVTLPDRPAGTPGRGSSPETRSSSTPAAAAISPAAIRSRCSRACGASPSFRPRCGSIPATTTATCRSPPSRASGSATRTSRSSPRSPISSRTGCGLEMRAGQPLLVLLGAVEHLRGLELLVLAALRGVAVRASSFCRLLVRHRLEVRASRERLIEELGRIR